MIDTTTIRSHAGPLAGLLQVAGRGGEELRGRLLLGRGPGGGVDDGLDAGQGLGQTFAGDDVDAARARHRRDLVALGLEDVHDMTSDPAGRARDCDLLGVLMLIVLQFVQVPVLSHRLDFVGHCV